MSDESRKADRSSSTPDTASISKNPSRESYFQQHTPVKTTSQICHAPTNTPPIGRVSGKVSYQTTSDSTSFQTQLSGGQSRVMTSSMNSLSSLSSSLIQGKKPDALAALTDSVFKILLSFRPNQSFTMQDLTNVGNSLNIANQDSGILDPENTNNLSGTTPERQNVANKNVAKQKTRRFYDVLNVLEGLDWVCKDPNKKSNYLWKGPQDDTLHREMKEKFLELRQKVQETSPIDLEPGKPIPNKTKTDHSLEALTKNLLLLIFDKPDCIADFDEFCTKIFRDDISQKKKSTKERRVLEICSVLSGLKLIRLDKDKITKKRTITWDYMRHEMMACVDPKVDEMLHRNMLDKEQPSTSSLIGQMSQSWPTNPASNTSQPSANCQPNLFYENIPDTTSNHCTTGLAGSTLTTSRSVPNLFQNSHPYQQVLSTYPDGNKENNDPQTFLSDQETNDSEIDVENITDIEDNAAQGRIAKVLLHVVETEYHKQNNNQSEKNNKSTPEKTPHRTPDKKNNVVVMDGNFKMPTPVKKMLLEMSPLSNGDSNKRRLQKIGVTLNSQHRTPDKYNYNPEKGNVPSPLRKLAAICPGVLGGSGLN